MINTTKGYQGLIATSLAVRQRTEVPPAMIEAWMRSEYGTLDHLDRVTFDREVGVALTCYDADPVLSHKLAVSYGLIN